MMPRAAVHLGRAVLGRQGAGGSWAPWEVRCSPDSPASASEDSMVGEQGASGDRKPGDHVVWREEQRANLLVKERN